MISAAPSKWGDLMVRTASAAVLIPIIIAAIWFGGVCYLVFIGLLSCLIAHEWSTIVHPGNQIQYALHLAAAACGTVLTTRYGAEISVSAILAITLISGMLVRFGDNPSSKWSYFGICYVGFPAIAFALLRQDPNYGFAAILWIFLIVWSADILAYFAGRIIGGPKLAPRISPKKTWAGLAGAIVGSALASLVFSHFMNLGGGLILALLAGVLAIVEQGGDLFESSLKRFYGVKDSGRLIPGHGGVIDRVDGLIVVAVVAVLIGMSHGQSLGAAKGLLLW